MPRVTILTLLSFLLLTAPARAQLDLHAHLDLKPGVGHLLRGSFSVPPLSLEWDTKFATKASSHSLNALETPPLIVASLYGHPYFSVTEVGDSLWDNLIHFNARDNVRRAIELEYRTIVAFTESHPQYAIAKTPIEAENLIADKRIPIVLSIEGAYGALETEADLKTWVDERGVAIVTPFHLTGDHFGGAAMLPGLYGFAAAPLAWFRAMLLSGGSCVSTYCKSPAGLTNDGRELIDRLLRHRVWIDLSHANDLEVGELLPILAARGQPVLVTHTEPRDIYPAERGLSAELMNAINERDGLIGLLPTDDMVRRSWKPGPCFSSLTEFRETVRQMISRLGPERVALASDINAPVTGLSPVCQLSPGQLTHELEERGFYTYSQWNTLAQYVSPDPSWHEKSLRHFLELWKKARATPP